MRRVFSNANDFYLYLNDNPPYEPPFQASFSPLPRIPKWSIAESHAFLNSVFALRKARS